MIRVIFVLHQDKSALFRPEKAKRWSPENLPHVIPIAFFKVGFTGRIVRVGSLLTLTCR